MAAQRTLKELANPQFVQELLYIVYPHATNNFVLKHDLIHLLPSFYGHVGEDPYIYLKEFHMVCSNMRLRRRW